VICDHRHCGPSVSWRTQRSGVSLATSTAQSLPFALVARPPVFGGKANRFNGDKAKAVPGVKHVVQIPRGVAVVADGFWHAKKAREALEVVWDDGPLAALDSGTQLGEYAELAKRPGMLARKEGDAAAALDGDLAASCKRDAGRRTRRVRSPNS